MPELDFSRLSSAMIISQEFAKKVMNPATKKEAIEAGYEKEKFNFTEKELKLLNRVIITLDPASDRSQIWEAVAKFWNEVVRLQKEDSNS